MKISHAFVALALAFLISPAFASNISAGGGSGGGGATPGGASGQLQYNNAGTFGGFALSGDCTLAQPNITCAKTNGTMFTSAATTAIGTSGAAIPLLNTANTWSAVQTHSSGDLALAGATSGALTLNCAATCGANTLTLPAGTTDFSATGGASQVVKQASLGSPFTVGRLQCADLSNAASGCSNAGANPAASIGLAAVNGTASTYMTSDSAPALSQAISPVWTGAHTFLGQPVTLSGNQSRAAWTTTGAGLVQAAATYTDTTSSGTVAEDLLDHANSPTFAASSATTYTLAETLRIDSPAAGTNATLSNAFPLVLNNNTSGNLSQLMRFLSNGSGALDFRLDANGLGVKDGATSSGTFWARSDNAFIVANTMPYAWGSPISITKDTGISRDAAGIVDVGNGNVADKTGRVNLTTLGVQGVTVANLPAATASGMIAYVTDANSACSAGTSPVGGGTNKCFVGSNGSAWKEFGI